MSKTSMIAVIPYYDEDTDRKEVNYGIDVETLEVVCLPPEPYDLFVRAYCYFSQTYNAHILK